MFYYIKPWIYPIILSVEMVIAVTITYLKSTHDGDAEKDFPYISDTGSKGVSASAISLLFGFYGFLVFINITIRFEQIKKTYTYKDHRIRFIGNIILVLAGLTSCFGVFLAGSFQINTLETVHNIGAVMAFGFGTGYCGLHAIFSFFLKELPGSNIIVNIIRIVMSVLQVAFLTSTFAVTLKYRSSKDLADKREAAILEWILGFLVTFYFLTFIPEFRHYDWTMQMERTKIKHKSNKVDINNIEFDK